MSRNFDIALLRTLVAVADLRSMTAASERLNLTQGAISQQIARLEALARGPLLVRKPKGLRLTSLGARLLGKARAMLVLNDEVWSEIEEGVVAGRVRLGLPYDLVGITLAPALKAFSEACPHVDLTLVCKPSPDLLTAVREGRLDMVVVEETIGSETGEVLAVDRLVWVGAHGGCAQSRTPLPISLVAENCIFRSSVVSALSRQGRETRTVFENGGLDATRATVRMDMAVSAWLAATVPADLDILSGNGLPELPSFAITLHLAAGVQGPAMRELAHHLRQATASNNRQAV